MLALELEEFLLCLMDLVLFDSLGLDFSLCDYFVLLSVEDQPLDNDIDPYCDHSAYQGSYEISYHNF